jgi:glycosyltransferase involved in cell wall biosynthesis
MTVPAMSRPLVSIITPSRNQAPFISQAIESVLAQDYPLIEYLVLDAVSDDGTVGILESFGDRVRWISEPDGGQADAIDRGIRMTRGEIVGWLNSDDRYLPGAVSAAVAALAEDPDAPAAYGEAEFIAADGTVLGPCNQVEPYSLDRLVNDLDFVVQPATFFRRSAYLAVGGLDRGLHYCLDYDLWIRFGQIAPLRHVPQRLAQIRVYPGTKTASGGLIRLGEIERMIRRHGRRTLPRGFQRETVRESARVVRGAVRTRRVAGVGQALRMGSTYAALAAGRRASRLAHRWRAGLFDRGILPEIRGGRLARFAREAGPVRPLPGLASPPTVAVVVPCHRHARYLAAMVDSIRAQTRPPDEVVFVDDASSDDSAAILRRVAEDAATRSGPSISVLTNNHRLGQAASLNRGIGHTTSQLIMILNDDDMLMPDAVEVVSGLMAERPELALVGATSIHFTGRPLAGAPTSIAAQHAPDGQLLEVRTPAEARTYRRSNDLNMTHSGSAFRREAWQAVGGYQPDRGRRIVAFSDRDFQLRVNALYPVGVSAHVAFSFWRRDSSVDHRRNT